jgi:hypothetical protein
LQADGACLIRLELFEPNERHVGVLFLIKWKTQVCTLVCENTELIALGKALTACSDRRVQRTRRVRQPASTAAEPTDQIAKAVCGGGR